MASLMADVALEEGSEGGESRAEVGGISGRGGRAADADGAFLHGPAPERAVVRQRQRTGDGASRSRSILVPVESGIGMCSGSSLTF